MAAGALGGGGLCLQTGGAGCFAGAVAVEASAAVLANGVVAMQAGLRGWRDTFGAAQPLQMAGGGATGPAGVGGAGAAAPAAPVGSQVSGKQWRHIHGRKEWDERGRGGYLMSMADAQEVLDAYHSGAATMLGRNRAGHIVVRCDKVTGYNNSMRNGYSDQPTNVCLIKGTTHPSVVPTNPTWTAP